MAVDIALLRLLRDKQEFRRVFGRIPASALNKQTAVLLADYGKYFEQFPEHDSIDMDVFIPLFRMWHPTLKDDVLLQYDTILGNARTSIPDADRHPIMRNILELRLATQLANALAQFEAGDLPNINTALKAMQDEFKADAGLSEELYITDDIDDLLLEDTNNAGLRSRLTCLRESMRPYRYGDFGILAARPDKGKTSFIASEVTEFASQKGYLDPDDNILWLNNEGMGKRIIPRIYQAALGATRAQLLVMRQKGVLKEAYANVVGRIDRIRVVDIHGMDNFSVEQIIEANRAKVVVYDMIDNIRGFGTESRTDQRLEEMYKWARDCAVNMEHVGFATSQISVEGDNMQFPSLSMLKDSKTGKQGACDFQIMMGALHDPAYDRIRYIGVPKNKLRVDGAAGDPRAEVLFNAGTSRFEDIPIAGEPNE